MSTDPAAAMQRLLATALAAIAGFGFMLAAHAGTESRTVADFEAVALEGVIDLRVRQASQAAVTVQADDRLLPLIETVVEAGAAGPTLKVRFKRGARISTRGPVQVSVDVVRLNALAAVGSGDIVVDRLETPSLRLTIAGSSDARLQQLATESLELRISGSGDVVASGTARKASIRIAGSGNAELAELVADDVSVSIAGSGDADVTANRALKVSIAGSGDVHYGGAVSDVKSSVAGTGTVARR